MTKYSNNNDYANDYFYERTTAHIDVFQKIALDKDLISDIIEICNKIICALKNKGGIYLCGNGGSAADAQHIAAEFVSRFYKERPGMNAEALSVNTSILTAIGNDYEFDKIFSRQLEAKAKAGDVLIGISTSGSSKNVLEALKYARNHGILSVLLMGGFDKPELKGAADYIIKVPSTDTPRIQEAHIFIGHVMAEYVEHEMFG